MSELIEAALRELNERREEHIKTQLRAMGLPLDPKRLMKAVHRRWPGKILVQEYRERGSDMPTLKVVDKREFRAARLFGRVYAKAVTYCSRSKPKGDHK